ncbi:hypothetical protein [Luteolibacter soli]|uniref:Uncharacterized protein n=1 Tax=Luteolibacter soli TaxID=3135280 RepID=A0ABU9B0L6_9BACT
MDPKKRYYEDSSVAFWAVGILLCVWSAWASGYTALWGGKAAGLSQDSWNWQDIPFHIYGWIGGFIVSLGLLIAIRKTTPRFIAVLLVPLLAFGVGLAGQAIENH